MESGTIKFYNNTKGFGFIISDQGGDDVFFHATQWKGAQDPQDKQDVSFEKSTGEKGVAAVNVCPV